MIDFIETINKVALLAKSAAPSLVYIGGCYALWRRVRRDWLSKPAERGKLAAQYAQQFFEDPAAHQFFKDLQLQHALKHTIGFAPSPTEFAPVFRFFREEQASLSDLKLAWPHRRPSRDGRLLFKLDAWANLFMWLQLLQALGYVLAGALIIWSIYLPPMPTPPDALSRLGMAFALMLCAILPLYAAQSERAVRRIEYRRRLRKIGGEESGDPPAAGRA